MISADWGGRRLRLHQLRLGLLPPNMSRSGTGIRVTGDKGVCYIGWPGDPVLIVPADDADIPEGVETVDIGAVKGYKPDSSAYPEKEIVPHFIDVISGRDACVGNGRQQAHVVELMTAAYESSNEMETIELTGRFEGFARDSEAARTPVHTKPATGRESDAG